MSTMLITLECSATRRCGTEARQTSEKRGNTAWFPFSPHRIQSLVMMAALARVYILEFKNDPFMAYTDQRSQTRFVVAPPAKRCCRDRGAKRRSASERASTPGSTVPASDIRGSEVREAPGKRIDSMSLGWNWPLFDLTRCPPCGGYLPPL
jgi:hypothetical protein